MTFEYTTGCVCTSLTVDEVETIDLGEDKMKEAVKVMIGEVFKRGHECSREVVKYLVEDTGDFHSLVYNDYDEVTVREKKEGGGMYLTSMDTPIADFLIVSELVDSYCKIVRQKEWKAEEHCKDERLLRLTLGMVDELDDFASLQQIFCTIMERMGEMASEPWTCDECGDTVYSYKLEI